MIQRLSIQNYAIIEELEIDFSGQLNVITGETGAGKSIIAGALGLILGDRADTSVLVNKERKCVVEGFFHAEGKKPVQEFLDQHELDPGNELVLRREIGTNGKSRAFINDTPVNLSQLQQLSQLLVDLHQQFDSLELGKNDFQREVLDALAGQLPLVSDYQLLYRRWQEVRKEWLDLQQQKQQFDKEADYNQFQFNELSEAGFRENELEEIEAELKLLGNAENIKAALDKAYYALDENEMPLVQQIKTVVNQLHQFSGYHAELPELIRRLQSSQIELQDIAGEINRISRGVAADPAKTEQLNERLSTGYKLLKKHGLSSTRELLELRSKFEEKLMAVQQMEDVIGKKEKESQELHAQANDRAARISEARVRQVKPLEEKVNKLLAQVGMPNARLKVEISKTELNSNGGDGVNFLFDANLPTGQAESIGQFQPVHKVASGGELSRLMLCIKSLVARSINLPTMVFDEIDTGISGEAARQVGMILKELADKRQVICITHQPQIAGKASAHFYVYKEIVNDKIRTGVRRLTVEERITTIAKMLSGEKPTAAAIENAREMVMN